ncbi:MAG: flavodoxin [Acidimicrobiales bacterium]|nr:flavodoxin [Acidimicrobiales bacterium]RZV46075.1 MAG: flavodoxin [Acidimicrobiales bacterium]
MRVLVVSASKHGSTTEIADAIAEQLRTRGLEVGCAEPEDARAPGYEAVVVGSAVYAGSWLKPARQFVDSHAAALAEVPVWLFSSGPLDDPDAEALPEKKVTDLSEKTEALGHHVFAGKLNRENLSRAERLVVKAVKAPNGDLRDWDDVRTWADEIADTLN